MQTVRYHEFRTAAKVRLAGLRNSLVGETLWYGAASVVSRAMSFLVLPILVRSLSQQRYGLLDLLLTVAAVGILIGGANFEPPLTRYYHEYLDRAGLTLLLSSMAMVLVLSTASVIVIGLGATHFTLAALNINEVPGEHVLFLYILALAGIPGRIATNTLSVIVRLQRKAAGYAAATVGYATLFLVLVAGAWALHLLSIATYLGIIATCDTALALALIRIASPWPSFQLTVAALGTAKRLLSFAALQFPAVGIVWLVANAGRFLLSRFSGLGDVALFGFASRLVTLVGFIGIAFQMTWGPYYMSSYRTPAGLSRVPVIMRKYLTAFGITALVVICFGREIVRLVGGDRYEAAYPVLALLIVSVWLEQVWIFTHIGSLLAERPGILSLSQLVGFTAFAILILPLVRWQGALGAAAATVVGRLTAVIVASCWSHSVYPIHYPYARAAGLFGILAAATAVVTWPQAPIAARIGVAVAGGIACLALAQVRTAAAVNDAIAHSP